MTAPISALDAARFLCERSGWRLTNLELQKMLYLAQMVYMGEHEGAPLFNGTFEAWDLGPVLPDIYRRARAFGAAPVQDVFYGARRIEEGDRAETLQAAVDQLARFTPAQLVNITHEPISAWYRNYRSGARGVVIPNEDIYTEAKERAARRDATKRVNA